MYEKPQYLTPDGYRRSGSNPNKDLRDLILKKRMLAQKKAAALAQKNLPQKRRGISDEAAKLIALAIKDLLKSK